MAEKFKGQKLAGLFTWEKDGRRGMNGRVELAGRLIVEPGSSVIVSPVKDQKTNGPKYTLILMPPDVELDTNTNGQGGGDDVPF